MEATEIIMNEEVQEVIPEIVEAGADNVGKAIAGGAVAIAIGYGIYRFGKFLYAKHKAKKAQKEIEGAEDLNEDDDVDGDIE